MPLLQQRNELTGQSSKGDGLVAVSDLSLVELLHLFVGIRRLVVVPCEVAEIMVGRSSNERRPLSTENLVRFALIESAWMEDASAKVATDLDTLPVSGGMLVGPLDHDVVDKGHVLLVDGRTGSRVDIDLLARKLDLVELTHQPLPPYHRGTMGGTYVWLFTFGGFGILFSVFVPRSLPASALITVRAVPRTGLDGLSDHGNVVANPGESGRVPVGQVVQFSETVELAIVSILSGSVGLFAPFLSRVGVSSVEGDALFLALHIAVCLPGRSVSGLRAYGKGTDFVMTVISSASSPVWYFG
jgi:hypothetical protein